MAPADFLRDDLRLPDECPGLEKLAGILEQAGYQPAEEETADFIIYNTCTVRENANLKVYGHLGLLKHRKKERRAFASRSAAV